MSYYPPTPFVLGGLTAVTDPNGAIPALQISGSDFAGSRALLSRHSADVTAPRFILAKSRTAGSAGYTAVATSDQLGVITFAGTDGTQLRNCAQMIGTMIAAAPSSADMQTSVTFQMCKAGSVAQSSLLVMDWTNGLRFGTNLTPILDVSGAVRANAGYANPASDAEAAFTATFGPAAGRYVLKTPITAARTVTLSTTGAVAGDTMRFTRTAAATGAFNWDIGGLKNLAVSTWCEVTFNGSAWELTAYGAL